MLFYRPERQEPLPLRLLGDFIDIVLVLLGVALISIMTVNVFSRAALDIDLAWNVEFGEFLLVWATFIGGAAAARRGAHMRISELLLMLPAPVVYVAELATRLAVLIVLGTLIWYGAVISISQMDQQMTVLYWPVGLQYAALPVGSALTAVYVVYETWRIAHGERPDEPILED
jgi:TRAP-type C4-dicarboxylate transport system permease small subunit